MPNPTPKPPDQPFVSEEAVGALAEANAIHELWGWWEDHPTREAKEGRQRARYSRLSEDIKDSWRQHAREQIDLVLPFLRAEWEGEARERIEAAIRRTYPLERTWKRRYLKAALAALHQEKQG